MPLIHSGSDAALHQNIHTLMHDLGSSPHVQSRAQALAIAYANQRRHRFGGGGVQLSDDYMDTSDHSGGNYALMENRLGQDYNGLDEASDTMAAGNNNRAWREAPRPDMSFDPMAVAAGYNNIGAGEKYPDVPLPRSRPKRADGGWMPWYVRNEARSMAVPHTGPIRSPVAGRTDHIPLHVPNGSYVLPAQHVSHLGQNNTDAGFSILNKMFTSPKIAHGRLPSAPRPPSPHFADGGAVDEREGFDDPVPIMAAGGEYVVPPSHVRAIGGGNLSHGHEVLDEWVKRQKTKHAKTIARLPGPAQD